MRTAWSRLDFLAMTAGYGVIGIEDGAPLCSIAVTCALRRDRGSASEGFAGCDGLHGRGVVVLVVVERRRHAEAACGANRGAFPTRGVCR